MSSVTLYIAKESNDRLQLWMDSADVLKRAVIKSLGAAVRDIITVKKAAGFQQMSVAEIIAKVRIRFDTLQKGTKSSLKLKMASMLKTVEDLDTHIAALTRNFIISDTVGLLVHEDHRVDYFRDSVFAPKSSNNLTLNSRTVRSTPTLRSPRM